MASVCMQDCIFNKPATEVESVDILRMPIKQWPCFGGLTGQCVSINILDTSITVWEIEMRAKLWCSLIELEQGNEEGVIFCADAKNSMRRGGECGFFIYFILLIFFPILNPFPSLPFSRCFHAWFHLLVVLAVHEYPFHWVMICGRTDQSKIIFL